MKNTCDLASFKGDVDSWTDGLNAKDFSYDACFDHSFIKAAAQYCETGYGRLYAERKIYKMMINLRCSYRVANISAF